MLPCDVEFLAEEDSIDMTPNFTAHVIRLIGGDIGPFEAGEKVSVPLWVALYLKGMHKCRIHPPDWMNPEHLTRLAKTQQDTHTFIDVPHNFLCLTRVLLDKAYDDLPDPGQLRVAVKDLWDYRDSRLRENVDSFVRNGASHAKVNNLTSMEINSMRKGLTASLDLTRALRTSTKPKSDLSSTSVNETALNKSLMNNTTLSFQ